MDSRQRAPRRPAGWIAPGPPPAGDRGRPELAPRDDEDLSLLSGDWRIFQQRRGHRWSLDDLVTAYVAASATAAPPARALDMGCGIGSVLMMVAWRFPDARCVGIEAQELSGQMARRSLAYNGIEDRCEVRIGDLRDPGALPEGAVFDLVTGTPPYFPPGQGIESERPQCAPCRFEHRGGVEEYCEAAARALGPRASSTGPRPAYRPGPGGRFVMCAATGETERTRLGARAARLDVLDRLDVIPRAGKAPLVSIFTMARTDSGADARWTEHTRSLVVRDDRGAWTPDFAEVRKAMGMPHTPPRARA